MVQMDGLAQSNDLVFLLAATNLPWQLDAAMLRRLEKRVSLLLPFREQTVFLFFFKNWIIVKLLMKQAVLDNC
jgi:katanin p60 ATPase-containing subunit A1